MMSEQGFPGDRPMTDDRVTRRDLAEGRVEKILSDRTAQVPIADFGFDFTNAMQIAEAAKVMATAGPMLPEWLRGNVGGCWAIIVRSIELHISPLTLANWTYLGKDGRVAYESQFYHAVIEAQAPLKERLQWQIIGEGDDRKCRVWGVFKSETIVREFTSEKLGALRPGLNERGQIKGSPLWLRKPEVQMFYDACRDWCRIHCPDILGGVYAREEIEENEGIAEAPMKDVSRDTSPKLRDRLRGPVGEGFEHTKSSIEEAIAAATPADPKRSSKGDATGPADATAPAETASSSNVPPAPDGGAVAPTA
ncbi:hypothetical protein [Bradyrhizobium sp. USDA 313]|uniref:hypothetical protein n=1 Tax=Bradyrhizobium sp. USDA 313 TaxID=3156307 RepID=UPI0035134355